MKAPQAPETNPVRQINEHLKRLLESRIFETLDPEKRRELLLQHVERVEYLLDSYDRLVAIAEANREELSRQNERLAQLQASVAALRNEVGVPAVAVH